MVLNIAHRGARSLAPENTIIAARKAFEIGADLWETDVSVTKDGHLILCHDDTLIRTTDVLKRFPDRSPWSVWDFTLEEIIALDAGSYFVQTDPFGQIAKKFVSLADQNSFKGEKIPTLAKALKFTQSLDWQVNLELKSLPGHLKNFPLVNQVLREINQNIDQNRVIISSFEHNFLREIKTKQPDIEVQALLGNSENEKLDWGSYEFSCYNMLYTLINEQIIRDLTQRNIKINLFTINKIQDMKRFIKAGAAGIFTDFPQRMIF